MGKKIVILLSISFLIVNYAVSAERGYKNLFSINADAGGFFTHVSYERDFFSTKNYYISGRIGVGTIPFLWGVEIPHRIVFNYYISENILYGIGMGGVFWFDPNNTSSFSYYLNPVVDIRINSDYAKMYKSKVKIMYEMSFSPSIFIYGNNFFDGYTFPPCLSFGIGYYF